MFDISYQAEGPYDPIGTSPWPPLSQAPMIECLAAMNIHHVQIMFRWENPWVSHGFSNFPHLYDSFLYVYPRGI